MTRDCLVAENMNYKKTRSMLCYIKYLCFWRYNGKSQLNVLQNQYYKFMIILNYVCCCLRCYCLQKKQGWKCSCVRTQRQTGQNSGLSGRTNIDKGIMLLFSRLATKIP